MPHSRHTLTRLALGETVHVLETISEPILRDDLGKWFEPEMGKSGGETE